MTAVDLPMPVREYFESRNRFDVESAIVQFEDAAVVEDENVEYRGRDSIRAWIEQTQNKYRPTFEVRSARHSGGRPLVVAAHCLRHVSRIAAADRPCVRRIERKDRAFGDRLTEE